HDRQFAERAVSGPKVELPMSALESLQTQKIALLSGATGQDAAYLSKLLLSKNYRVVLTDRHVSCHEDRHWRLEELGIKNKVEIVYATLQSYESLIDALDKVHPDEIYS